MLSKKIIIQRLFFFFLNLSLSKNYNVIVKFIFDAFLVQFIITSFYPIRSFMLTFWHNQNINSLVVDQNPVRMTLILKFPIAAKPVCSTL